MQTEKIALLLTCLFFTSLAFGQGISQQYAGLIKQAENLFAEENYQASGEAYSDAFKSNGWLGAVPDRYNAARAWALARNPDSAFYQLDRIALKGCISIMITLRKM